MTTILHCCSAVTILFMFVVGVVMGWRGRRRDTYAQGGIVLPTNCAVLLSRDWGPMR